MKKYTCDTHVITLTMKYICNDTFIVEWKKNHKLSLELRRKGLTLFLSYLSIKGNSFAVPVYNDVLGPATVCPVV